MKTYKRTIEKPRLVIAHDEDSVSPRDADNLGYFIIKSNDYRSPDENRALENIIEEAGDEATSTEEHIALIKKKMFEQLGEKVIEIYPICTYEHGAIAYKIGEYHGFDYSNNGFYVITEASCKVMGTDKKDFKRVVENELSFYQKWANGETLMFTLYDDKGALVDMIGGFYDIKDIKEYLPDEFKDENLEQYLID